MPLMLPTQIDHEPSTRPKWTAPMRKYQVEGARFLAFPRSRGRLLADGPGFGKTRQALGAAQWRLEEGLSEFPTVIVITTAIARGDWKREAQKFWPTLPVHIVGSEPNYQRVGESDEAYEARRMTPLWDAIKGRKPSLVVASYESAGKLTEYIAEHSLLIGSLVVDEAHNIKKEKSAFSLAVRPLVARAESTMLLTATPIHNRCEDLHNLLDVCAFAKFGSKWNFARRFFQIHTGTFGSTIGGLLDKPGLKAAIRPYVLSRDVSEAYGELPARIRELISVEPDRPILKMSKEQLRAQNRKGNMEALNTQLRALAQVKLKRVVELAVSLQEPVVVYAFERAHAQSLAVMLNKARVPAILATGLDTTAARDKKIEAWKAGDGTALVCTMDAVKESATLVRAAAMIFADLDWLPGKMIQLEGRIDPSRQPEGERRPVRYFYVVVEGGHDEVVAERVVEKIAQQEGIIGGGDGNILTLKGVLKPLTAPPESNTDIIADLIGRLEARAARMEGLL